MYFHGYDLHSLPSSYLEFDATNQIPIPAEVKRMTVNKDTGETLLHVAARMGYMVSVRRTDTLYITQTRLCNILQYFTAVKSKIFR